MVFDGKTDEAYNKKNSDKNTKNLIYEKQKKSAGFSESSIRLTILKSKYGEYFRFLI